MNSKCSYCNKSYIPDKSYDWSCTNCINENRALKSTDADYDSNNWRDKWKEPLQEKHYDLPQQNQDSASQVRIEKDK